MPETRSISLSPLGMSPEEVAARTFSVVRRGFEPDAVRRFLEEVAGQLRQARAREMDLSARLADAEQRAASPVLDESVLSAALGAETARVLRVAHEAAQEVVTKAEQRAQALVEEASSVHATRAAEAEAEAARVVDEGRRSAADIVERTKVECRAMLEKAREARRQILEDLSGRRRDLHGQVAQLNAAKDTLAAVFAEAAEAVDEIQGRLGGSTDEARGAAGETLEHHRTEGVIATALDDAQLGLEPAADPGDGEAPEFGDELVPGEGPHDDDLVAELDSLEPARPSPLAPPPAGTDEPLDDHEVEAFRIIPSPAADGEAGDVAAEEGEAGEAGDVAAEETEETEETEEGDEAEGEAEARGGELAEEPAAGEDEDAGAAEEVGEAPDADVDAAGEAEEPGEEGQLAEAAADEPPETLYATLEDEAEALAGALAEAEAGLTFAEAQAVARGEDPGAAEAVAGGPTEAPAGEAPAEKPAPAPAAVDALFARIRASRAEEVAKARAVLADTDEGEPPAPETAGEPVEEPAGEGAGVQAAKAEGTVDASAGDAAAGDAAAGVEVDERGVAGGEPEAVEQARRRDEAIEPIRVEVTRTLKRVLRSEQNELLDTARTLKVADAAGLLGGEEAATRLAEAVAGPIAAAWRAGRTFAGAPAGEDGDKASGSIADEMALEVIGAIEHRLEEGIASLEASGPGGEEVLGDLVGVAYREWKGGRIDAVAAEAVLRAHAAGTIAGATELGVKIRWAIEADQPCADCDDNALSEPLDAGTPFPTGQAQPPLHAGCRCVLVPAPG